MNGWWHNTSKPLFVAKRLKSSAALRICSSSSLPEVLLESDVPLASVDTNVSALVGSVGACNSMSREKALMLLKLAVAAAANLAGRKC